jgi:tungstate transport system substrate-binding protein
VLPLLLALLLAPQKPDVLLATTTSTRDAGLLDSLLPLFEAKTGYKVRVVAVGSGQALEMGRRGDADVVLTHAPDAERVLMDSGYFINRRIVMHNDFLIVGPVEDPARVRGSTNAMDALRHIANTQGPFVSRGDRSGTHILEQKLWKPHGRWYIESGQGMAATLQMADQKHAYTLTDRATYLAWRDRLQLVPLVEGDTLLFNVYHVMEARQGGTGARALAEFLVSPSAQAVIGRFGTTRFGRPLFIPDAVQP